jgi:hypothetical protein
MTRTPTDREILRAIYELYYAEFVDFDDKPHSRATKVYVPIDVPAVAKSISVDPEIVFGRLHYHLQSKYGRKDGDVAVPLFQVQFPSRNSGKPERHVINFPLLDSVLAELEYEHRKFRLPFVMSIISASVALLAFAVTVMAFFRGTGLGR